MRIGIDIDGVLTDVGQFSLDYFSKYLVEHNIPYKVEKQYYEEWKTFCCEKEASDAFWNEYLDYYAKYEKPRNFAREVIRKLKNEGHEIFIITARWLTNEDTKRGMQMRKRVKRWLKKNKVDYDQLIFSKAKGESKTQEMLDYKIDVMIEDNPNNIKELSKIVPIICYHTHYNQDCDIPNVTRCYSWYDIYNSINQITSKIGKEK